MVSATMTPKAFMPLGVTLASTGWRAQIDWVGFRKVSVDIDVPHRGVKDGRAIRVGVQSRIAADQDIAIGVSIGDELP